MQKDQQASGLDPAIEKLQFPYGSVPHVARSLIHARSITRVSVLDMGMSSDGCDQREAM
jgi:hypothetical protein